MGRYSPPICTGARVRVDRGNPRPGADLNELPGASEPHDADGYAPLHGLTNGFSKKLDYHIAAIAIHFMHYNFARPHTSLSIPQEDGPAIKRTPAMTSGVADHVWTLQEIAGLLD